MNWAQFPKKHLAEIKTITSYSIYGWLFTLSSILLGAGGVVVAGYLMSATEVAKLQLAVVLYTGVAAFLTGSMAPLATITAKLNRTLDESKATILKTAKSLVDESSVLSALLLAFFIFFSDVIVSALFASKDITPTFLTEAANIVRWMLIPPLLFLPLFTFRFSLVGDNDNASFCKRALSIAVFFLVLGVLSVLLIENPLALAVCLGAGIASRSLTAYLMGLKVIEGISFSYILMHFLSMFVPVCLFGYLVSGLHWNVEFGLFRAEYFPAAVYLGCTLFLLISKRRILRVFPILGDYLRGNLRNKCT